MHHAVIMAGGSGTRLWPLSRRRHPKQLLRIFEGKSLLRRSFERLRALLPAEQIYIITGRDYIEYVEKNAVKISMDGKSRWADNIMIERWFRTLKYDEVYLKDYENIRDARSQIGDFIYKYNFEKLHSALGYQTPAENYYSALTTWVA